MGEPVGGHADRPGSLPGLGVDRALERPLRPERAVDVQPLLRARPPHELDHARQRAAPVAVRPAAAQHLHPLQRPAGHAAPVDPAAEGIVQGDAVVEDEGAAGPAASEAAQRHPLGGRVRDAAARAAEQREAGHEAQRVVQHGGGGGREVFLGKDVDAGRRLAQALPPPAGHRHLLAEREPREDQCEPAPGLGQAHGLPVLRVALRVHADRDLAGAVPGEGEAALDVRRRLDRPAVSAHGHDRDRDGTAGAVLDDAGDAEGRPRRSGGSQEDAPPREEPPRFASIFLDSRHSDLSSADGT